MALKTQGTELFYLSAADTMSKVGKVTGVTGTGGPKAKIDVTDLDAISDKQSIAGLADPGAASCPLNFDPSNVTHQALLAAYQAGTTLTWVVGYADGTAPPTAAASVITYPTTRTYATFQGYIENFPVDAAGNSKLEAQMSVQRSGAKTFNYKT